MIDASVLQSVQRCFEKKSRVVVKMMVRVHNYMRLQNFIAINLKDFIQMQATKKNTEK